MPWFCRHAGHIGNGTSTTADPARFRQINGPGLRGLFLCYYLVGMPVEGQNRVCHIAATIKALKVRVVGVPLADPGLNFRQA